MTQQELNDIADYTLKTTDEIPVEAKRWLFSYGILPNEIKELGIKWNVEHQLLVLIQTPDYWQGRTFGNQKMKYLSKGNKPLTVYGKGDKLVCVEDVLSAIKISRLSPEWCAMPLLGSHLSERAETYLKSTFDTVVVWLDRDKAINAVKIARNLKQKGLNSSVVISPKDPKEYSKGEISEWLKNK